MFDKRVIFFFISGILICCVAAHWQYSKYQAKEAINAQLLIEKEVQTYSSDLAVYDRSYIDIDLQSKNSRSLFIIDQVIYNGKVGYDVVLPLLSDSAHPLFIILGWFPREDKDKFWELSTRILEDIPNTIIAMKRNWPVIKWVTPYINLSERLWSHLSYEDAYTVYDLQHPPTLLYSQEIISFLQPRVLRQIPGSEKNLSYTFQWTIFAILLTMAFIVYIYKAVIALYKGRIENDHQNP